MTRGIRTPGSDERASCQFIETLTSSAPWHEEGSRILRKNRPPLRGITRKQQLDSSLVRASTAGSTPKRSSADLAAA